MAANEAQEPASVGGECRSEGLDAFVGRDPTEAVANEIRAKSGAKIFRYLQPGQMVTMEFSAERVNAYVGTNGKIERVSCG